MKSALGALLLRNNAISPQMLEKAEERQLVYGGTLDTALLETEVVTEAVMLRFLPRANQVPLALPEELIDTDQVSLQLCSRDLAEQYAIVPLRVVAETLRVLVVDPVDLEALATLADELSLAIEPVIVPEYRWQVAFAARFGTELAPRYVTLAQPAKQPIAPHGLATATDETLDALSRTRTGRNTQPGTGAALTRAITTKTPSSGEPTAAERQAALAGALGAPTPISVNDAIRALGRVDERDDIIELVLRAMRSRAEWAGLMTVRDHVASGRSALAAVGFDNESIAYASLPLDVPSSLASAVQSRSPVSGPLAANSPVFDAQLSRFGGTDSTNALFMPIALRDRVMAVFVAHRGERELSASDVLELLPLGPAAAHAFERAIAKKRPSPRMSKQPRTVPIEPVALAEITADAKLGMATQADGARSTNVHTVPSRTGTTSPPALAAVAAAPLRSALGVEEAEAILRALETASPLEQQAEIATLGVAAASLVPHLLRLFPGALRASRLEVPGNRFARVDVWRLGDGARRHGCGRRRADRAVVSRRQPRSALLCRPRRD
ncbi:MAG: hypothetical protein IPL79_19305 [Myxococcales bacterium]|nr:hypothetical protein [Myxococcales bacterium]